MCRPVGASPPCRWPWTFTAVGGTRRSGRWLSASGGSVAHSAATCCSVNPGVVQGLGVEVMVAEDEQALAGAAAYVEHQAPIAPGVRVGDVAQADDGVAGPYAAAPFAQQVVVHLLDVSERPVPAEQDGSVVQVQVGPDPGPLGRRLDDRDRRSLHRSGQLRLGAGAGTGVGGGLKLEIGFPEVPEGLGLQQWLFGHRDLANVCGDFYLGS